MKPNRIKTSLRNGEDGPPQLPEEKLQQLDEATDKVELDRLLKMGVLKQLSGSDDMSGKMNLQSKFGAFVPTRRGQSGHG